MAMSSDGCRPHTMTTNTGELDVILISGSRGYNQAKQIHKSRHIDRYIYIYLFIYCVYIFVFLVSIYKYIVYICIVCAYIKCIYRGYI